MPKNTTNIKSGEVLNLSALFTTKNLEVQIPIIQRDYAQGRVGKIKLRNRFIDDIYLKLVNDEFLDLDFVYGSTKIKSNGNSVFIPLDGQQRLTTLFLLHYYLALRDNRFADFLQIFTSNLKSKFSYQTRISSKDFCNELLKSGEIDLDNLEEGLEIEKNQFSKTLKNSEWFFRFWENDPTVSGMLRMLDAIHYKFKNTTNLFEKLIREKPLITFQFLDLNENKLTDDLYIKMNARGKPLTDFENFKAQFEKTLIEIDENLQKEFSKKIDGVWCDLFWKYCFDDKNNFDKIVDTYFLNMIEYISKMLFYSTKYYKNITDENGEIIKEEITLFDFTDFETVQIIFSEKDNIIFLIKTLDLFSSHKLKSKEHINSFFINIFSLTDVTDKISLFDTKNNLFEKLIFKDNFDQKDELLLFAIIFYHQKFEIEKLTISDNLIDYLRIIRNYVFAINQKGNNTQKDIYVSNLRVADNPVILNLIKQIADSSVNSNFKKLVKNNTNRRELLNAEIFKLEYLANNTANKDSIFKLENHRYLKGNLQNFSLLLTADTDLQFVANSFYEIWNDFPTEKVSKSLLSFSDYSVFVGNCYFGDLWFFGSKDKWDRIFMDVKDDFKILLKNYFDYLKHSNLPLEESLSHLILNPTIEEEWVLLILKYKNLLTSTKGIYSFRDNQYYKIDRIEGTSLRGLHINVFIHELVNNINLKVKLRDNGWAQDTEESKILLRHSAIMIPNNTGWKIDSKSVNIEKILEGFNFKKEVDKNIYYLEPTESEDLIEVGISFLNKYYASN